MKIRIFLLCIFAVLRIPCFAQKKMLYPGIEKGKHDIGYQTIIDLDYSRTYNLVYPTDTISQRHDPRPIIINIWYPAQVSKKDKQMLYGDYIKVETQDETLKTFIKRIEDYNLKNSIFYSFYLNKLSAEQNKKLKAQQELPVEVYKQAAPLKEKFPLVIYHAGLGGTLNDNTILCEFLASHGFVVVTSAFQGNDYKDVNLDWDLERSTRDLDFILNRIKGLPFIDFSKIAAVGHSYGAQAVLAYRTEDFSPISWLVILDTTMDYSVDGNPKGFERLTEKVYRKINNLDVPMLVFANPMATFRVIDSLKNSNRIYGTIDLEHNDFTSLTSFSKKNGLMNRNENPDTVWTKYTLIANYCLNFLRSNIYGDKSAMEFIASKRPFTNIYEVPKGQKLGIKIPEYVDYTRPPSEVQFQKLVYDKNIQAIDKVISLHEDFRNEDLINETGYDWVKKDVDFAIHLFNKNVEMYPGSFNAWDSLGEAYMIKGDKESAIRNYKKSIELNPKNENGIKMLEKLTR